MIEWMNDRTRLRFRFTLFLLFLFLVSCTFQHHRRAVYDPPLAYNIDKVVKGKTTNNKILEWFGVPYLMADGPEITFYPNSPYCQMRAKQKEELIELKKQIEKNKDKYNHYEIGGSLSNMDVDIYDRIDRLQPYSSIDNEHIALLYLEVDLLMVSRFIPSPVSRFSTDLNYCVNRLLFLIDKKTGIVDEFSYWQEFKVE